MASREMASRELASSRQRQLGAQVHKQKSLGSPVHPPLKDFKDQVSPSAIIESPQNDSRAIHQPNTSHVNSFQVGSSIAKKDQLRTKASKVLKQATLASPELPQQHLGSSSRNHAMRQSPKSLPFRLSSQRVHQAASSSDQQAQSITVSGQNEGLKKQWRQKLPVGTSLAKNHSHYFNNKLAATAASLMAGAGGPSQRQEESQESSQKHEKVQVAQTAKTTTTRHKVSQSSTISHSRQQLSNLQTAVQKEVQMNPLKTVDKSKYTIYGDGSKAIESMHRRFQPLGSWHSPETLAISNQSSADQQHFASTQSLGINSASQAKSSTDRQIPVQKVRIAKKVPQAANTVSRQQHQNAVKQQPSSLSLKVTAESERGVQRASSANESSTLKQKVAAEDSQDMSSLPENNAIKPSQSQVGLVSGLGQAGSRGLASLEQLPFRVSHQRVVSDIDAFKCDRGLVDLIGDQSGDKLSQNAESQSQHALSARTKNQQRSTKVLRKQHVNFERNIFQNQILKFHGTNTPVTAIQANAQESTVLKKLGSYEHLAERSRYLQMSQTLQGAESAGALNLMAAKDPEESKKSDKENMLAPPQDHQQQDLESQQNSEHARIAQSKRKSVGGLQIQIPQSPVPNGDEIGSGNGQRKQMANLGSNSSSRREDTNKLRLEPSSSSQVIRVASSSALAGNIAIQKAHQSSSNGGIMGPQTTAAMRLDRAHQSPLLEQIQASQSAITANLPTGEQRPLQVYRPNCQSTRNLPSTNTTMLSGCVPPTASTDTAQKDNVKGGSNRLPPAPASSKNHQQSRSQSGARQNFASNDSEMRSNMVASKQSSPLAQYANYAFQPACKILLPPKLSYEASKTSVRRNGVVRGYAANTHQGLVRNYNEDRVSIILNISEPQSRRKLSPTGGEPSPWPICSFFGIYDGHGGSQCADFLRDNLHTYVVREPCFPDDPREALKLGFAKAEKRWTEDHATTKDADGRTLIVDRSGSCAIVVLVIEEMCYVANVGDSRAVMSGDGGKRTYSLSRDHKPSDEHEKQRVLDAGGKIYSRQIPASTKNQLPPGADNSQQQCPPQPPQAHIVGPERIFPGRLSVSRSFGDIEAKLEQFGGNPRVLIAIPEIKAFRIKREYDFIALGCDGIFDRINNKEAIQVIWNSTKDLQRMYPEVKNVHQLAGLGVDYLVKNSLLRRSLDNVTAVIVAFRNFKHCVFGDDGELVPSKGVAAGQNHPNTTKAVPQVGAMKLIKAASSRNENSAKLDARSNSQAFKQQAQKEAAEPIQGSSNMTATRINSCQQLTANSSNSKLAQGIQQRSPAESQNSSKEGLSRRIGDLFGNLAAQYSQATLPTNIVPKKTLTRQDKEVPLHQDVAHTPQGNFKAPSRSTSTVSMSQRIQQQAALIDSKPRTFMMKRGTANMQQKLSTTTAALAEAKIPQLVSKESLNSKLGARKLLHKSQSSGAGPGSGSQSTKNEQSRLVIGQKSEDVGNGGASDQRQADRSSTELASQTPTVISTISGQGGANTSRAGLKKHTMPRFFKFDDCSDREEQDKVPKLKQ